MFYVGEEFREDLIYTKNSDFILFSFVLFSKCSKYFFQNNDSKLISISLKIKIKFF